MLLPCVSCVIFLCSLCHSLEKGNLKTNKEIPAGVYPRENGGGNDRKDGNDKWGNGNDNTPCVIPLKKGI